MPVAKKKKPAKKAASKKAPALRKIKRKTKNKPQSSEFIYDSQIGKTDALFVSLPDQAGGMPSQNQMDAEITDALKELNEIEQSKNSPMIASGPVEMEEEKNPEAGQMPELKENKKSFWQKLLFFRKK